MCSLILVLADGWTLASRCQDCPPAAVNSLPDVNPLPDVSLLPDVSSLPDAQPLPDVSLHSASSRAFTTGCEYASGCECHLAFLLANLSHRSSTKGVWGPLGTPLHEKHIT